MPSLPIPVFAALVLFFLFVRLCMNGRAKTSLALLVALCAFQTIVIALAQHYRVSGIRELQPITASMVAPLAWWSFQTTAIRPAQKSDLLHALVPITALAALITGPNFLDIFIPAVFIAYGLVTLNQSLQGSDAQPHIPLENAELPSRIWLIIGVALILSALSDVLILSVQAIDHGYLQPWIITIFSVGNLLLIGALSLSEHLVVDPRSISKPVKRTDAPDEKIWHLVETYMREKKPYLDPDLTLARLSRKLSLPAKTLSKTINRATKGNVSRYINDARIETAKTALMEGESVTSAMLSSGFNTKSNFNREFLRLLGTSPSAWLAQQNDKNA